MRSADDPFGRAGAPEEIDPYTKALRQSLEAGSARVTSLPGGKAAFLSLSGGSLNGAYGAGYLDEWRKRSPGERLPAFATVTGISTGAILATFAFTNRTDAAVRGYSIEREGQLLKTFVKPKNGKLGPGDYIALLRRGSLGDLAPLRERLNAAIDDSTLRDVADGAVDGRLLLVGVVDVDTGEAVALDLTEMAKRYVNASSSARDNLKHCYIDAVIASSSAPMAAAPVYIDNRMYIDGGARFGMFADRQIRAAELFHKSDEGRRLPAPDNFLLINGDQRIKQRCAKRNETACGTDPTGGDAEPAKWRLTELALRSEQILANQVYRFSESQVANGGSVARVTKIKDDVAMHKFTMNDVVLGSGERSCDAWADADVRVDDPVQFKPRYMRCLIDYGRHRAKAEHWWLPSP